MEEDLPASDILHGLVIAFVIALAGIAVAVASGTAYAFLNPGEEAAVIAQITEEVEARTPRACIAQAAIYERMPKPVCASGTTDVPATALSYPLASKE